jgi:lysozyme
MLTEQGRALLKLHEGYSSTVYTDTRGIRTIGYGHNLQAEPYFEGKRIPGYITADLAERILSHDIAVHEDRLLTYYPWVKDEVDPVRRDVLINMTFNIRNFPKDFPTFFSMIKAKHYNSAADFMESWPWYKQVKSRAVTLCHLMRTGEYM